jgi:NAD(P)-dependent dehydrogenase (short-subunit alcohol dehydrogenase family)
LRIPGNGDHPIMAEAQSRVVLITGASGGIGAVMTAAMLADGHSVAALDHNPDTLKKLAAAHDAKRLFPVLADVEDAAACPAAVEKTVAHFGRIDGLVNNAGIGMSAIRADAETRHPQADELTAGMWDRFFAINVRAPLLLTGAALPHMRKARWGRIVNNTTSYQTMHRVLPYGATKAALESMSAVWARQLEGTGITVNVLVPGGPTDTPFISDAAGWDRGKMLRPAIMGPPLRWLVSEAAGDFSGRRITAMDWDAALPPADAAKKASRDIGWPELIAPSWWS